MSAQNLLWMKLPWSYTTTLYNILKILCLTWVFMFIPLPRNHWCDGAQWGCATSFCFSHDTTEHDHNNPLKYSKILHIKSNYCSFVILCHPNTTNIGVALQFVWRSCFSRYVWSETTKSQQVLSRNRARCSDDWKRTDSHTSHASHTQQNRHKEGSQRTFARPRTLQELHHSAPSNNVQRRARRRGSNNQKIIRTGYQVTYITVPSNFPDSSVTL